MKHKLSEKIIKEIMAYAREKGITEFISSNTFEAKEVVKEITSHNLSRVLRGTFRDDEAIITRIIPYLEFNHIANMLAMIEKYSEYLRANPRAVAELLASNEELLQKFSGQKKKLYNQLKKLSQDGDFKALEAQFFQDVINAKNIKPQKAQTFAYRFNMSLFIDSYPENKAFVEIEESFAKFISYLCANREICKKLEVKAITYISNVQDDFYIVCIEPSDEEKVNFFFNELIERFPEFDKIGNGQENHEVKIIFIDSILFNYTIPGTTGRESEEDKSGKVKANKI